MVGAQASGCWVLTHPTYWGLPVFAIFHTGPRRGRDHIVTRPAARSAKVDRRKVIRGRYLPVGESSRHPLSPSPIQEDTAVLVEDTAEPITSADVKAGDHRLLDHPGLWVRAAAVVGKARVGLAEGVR